jgi:hypothetical protein
MCSAVGASGVSIDGMSSSFSNKSYIPKDEHMAAYLEEHQKDGEALPRPGIKAHPPRGEC